MAVLKPEVIKDTKELISFYKTNPRFRITFDKIVARNINATYRGRPVKLYAEILANINIAHKSDYKEIRTIVLHDDKGKIGKLFDKVGPRDFNLIHAAYTAARRGLNSTHFEDKQVEEINKIEKDFEKDRKEKQKSYEKREEAIKAKEEKAIEKEPEEKRVETEVENKDKEEETNTPGTSPENKKSYNPASPQERARLKTALDAAKVEIPKNVIIGPSGQALSKPIEIPEVPENVLVGLNGRPISRPIGNFQAETQQEVPQSQGMPSLPSIPGNQRGGFVRKIFSRGSTQINKGAATTTTRFAAGKAAGKALVAGTGKAIARLGVGTAAKAGIGALAKLGISAILGVGTGGVAFVVGLVATFVTTAPKEIAKLIKWIGLILIAVILLFFVSDRGMKQTSLYPPYIPAGGMGGSLPTPTPTPTPGGPGTPPGPSSDIDTCDFFRGDMTPSGAKYQSPRLLSYFQEASVKSGIPPAVIAAFVRVESPSIVNYTDANLSSFGCPESPTGALGLMQLQPQGTLGHDVGAITQGASFIGKNYNDLTRTDYCDLRKNILMGAGFILKKMSYLGYGDGTRWQDSWTTSRPAIDALVNAYYGCLKYPSCSSGPHNYGDDVWNSLQNCKQVTPSPSSGPAPNTFNAYFCQQDPAWANSSIVNSGGYVMADGGCGITSLAMVLKHFGLNYDPASVLTEFNKHPSWYTPSGANMGAALEWAGRLGFEYSNINPSASNLASSIPRYIDAGYLIIGSQWMTPPLSHIFVISGYNSDGTVVLNDPNRCIASVSRPTSQILSYGPVGDWIYAIAIKKVR